jgi:hypothetical protein
LFCCYLRCSVVICVVLLLFVLFCCYLCCSVVICVVLLLFALFCCYLCCSVVICVVLLLFVLFGCYLCCSMYCLCVNVYCHRVTTQLQLTNISYHNRPNSTPTTASSSNPKSLSHLGSASSQMFTV